MINDIKENKKTQAVCWIVVGIVAVGIMIALIWRIQCSISYYDEVFNIYVSYMTVALGQRHLVENTLLFSMGDLFNLPFVYFFHKITGTTEGIVLFIRFAYLGCNMFLAFVCWKAFGQAFGKKSMAMFGLVLVTFFPMGMYTLSYDTAALYFSLMGGVLLLGSEMRGNEKTGIYRYFAGICHACMAYSYPLLAGVILAIVIGITIWHLGQGRMKGKQLLRYWLPYFGGGMTVLGIFLVYVSYVGWENVFFLKQGFVENSLSGREIGELVSAADSAENAGSVGNTVSSANTTAAETVISDIAASDTAAFVKDSVVTAAVKRIGKQLYGLVNYMWIQQKATVGFTLVMLVQWGVGLVKKGKWRLLLIPEILLVAFFLHTEISCFGGTTMFAYCFCWAPFLLFYLQGEEKKQAAVMFLILGLISLASFVGIGFTSVRTDKAHVGLYCGAICTFLFMVMLTKRESFAGISLSIPVILLVAVCNMGMGYIDHFQGADIDECTYRMKRGIFKGMMTWEQDIQYENLRTCLEGFQAREGAKITMTDENYFAACLEGDLKERGGMTWLAYWEGMIQSGMEAEDAYGRDQWADVVLIKKGEEESYSNLMETILKEHFELISSEYDYYLYIKTDGL